MKKTLIVNLQDNENKIIQFEIPKFDSSKKFYWKYSIEKFLDILQEISNVIINKPYPLDPNKFLMTNIDGKPFKIYRQNHDATHSLRQYFYISYLFDSIKKHAPSKWLNTIDAMTDEEISILHLSAFCLRIGRLNEDNRRAGSLHEAYSSELFESIALQLGFNEGLIQNTKLSMVDDSPMIPDERKYTGFEGIGDEIKSNKYVVFSKFLHMAHHADLVRCWDSKGEKKFSSIHNKLMSDFLFFLNDKPNSEKFSIELMDYAAHACIATGNKVKLFSPEHDMKYDCPYAKRKKAKCISDIAYGFEKIKYLRK